MQGNTRRKLKKEYIPLLIALLVLAVLVLLLILVVFYRDNKGLVVPDLPEKESIDIGIFDFDSGKYTATELDISDTTRTKVQYKVITDYYTNGILISDPRVNYDGNEIIIKSGFYADTPFVSVIDKEGKLKWISKISMGKYDKLKIIDVIKKNNYYHVFAVGIKDNKNDNIAIKLNSKGNEELREIISKESENMIKSIVKTGDGFAVMTDGKNNLEIYYVSDSYKLLSNPFFLKDAKNNVFQTYIPRVSASLIKNNVITMVVSYIGASSDTMYLVDYDLSKSTVSFKKFNELNRISSPYTDLIYSYDGSFYTIFNNKAYQFSKNGELLNKYDYSSVKLGELKDCSAIDPDDIYVKEGQTQDCTDRIWGEVMEVHDNSTIVVEGTTSSEYIAYDVFDTNLRLKKRFVHDMRVYESSNLIYLSSVFVNNKLYEIYQFGVDTPSILISIIG